jgi:hypothetical protein
MKIKCRVSSIVIFVLGLCLLLPSEESMGQQRRPSSGGGAKRPGPSAKPASAKTPSTNRAATNPATNSRPGTNKNLNQNSNNRGSNNKVNIDKSRGDVNINVDNSKNIKVNNVRNTSVRHNSYRHYSRPPYVYGGYRYRCYHPYYYHPYRPFYWGPMWHPWGFFVATLATTAIIVSFADADLPPAAHNGQYFVLNDGINLGNGAFMGIGMYPGKIQSEEYYYDEGVFYLKGNGGYTVVAAPVGGIIKTLPKGYETVDLDDAGTVKNYYYGGTFYEKVSKGYKVVQPTSGVVVSNLAEGGEEVKMGEVTYVKLGDTYYQPIQKDGKNMYEVVDIEEDK